MGEYVRARAIASGLGRFFGATAMTNFLQHAQTLFRALKATLNATATSTECLTSKGRRRMG